MFEQTYIALKICAKIVDLGGTPEFFFSFPSAICIIIQATETISSKNSKYLQTQLKFGH